MSKQKFSLVPAQRKKMHARIAVSGGSGAGKTYTSLELATGLAGESGNIAVLDSQHGQSCLYADIFDFRILELDSHSPATYAEAIRAIGQQGFEVLIIDSISMAWMGPDGALAQVDKFAKEKFGGNGGAAWSVVTPMQNDMIEAILSYPGHVIVTLRSKIKYIIEPDANGKTKPVAVGIGNVQRDGFDYVCDLEIYMDAYHCGTIIKTRYHDIEQMEIEKPDRTLADYLLERLNVGKEQGEPHWSESFKNRQYLLGQLDRLKIPHRCLFECYGANSWADMKQVAAPEGGSKAIVQKVHEYFAENG